MEIGLLFIGAKNLPGPLRLLELLEEEEEDEEVDCCCEGPSTESVDCQVLTASPFPLLVNASRTEELKYIVHGR